MDASTCLERSNHGSNEESIQIYGSHTIPKWRTAYVSRPIETVANEASTYIYISMRLTLAAVLTEQPTVPLTTNLNAYAAILTHDTM